MIRLLVPLKRLAPERYGGARCKGAAGGVAGSGCKGRGEFKRISKVIIIMLMMKLIVIMMIILTVRDNNNKKSIFMKVIMATLIIGKW